MVKKIGAPRLSRHNDSIHSEVREGQQVAYHHRSRAFSIMQSYADAGAIVVDGRSRGKVGIGPDTMQFLEGRLICVELSQIFVIGPPCQDSCRPAAFR
ncbi:protein of unknown function (plasmid) [Cupriavidus taiwanensis]|uniref:Uncharacterized protein n=1 Tax=Cupriavidus taiwanensis TaxID=164546 RepID=A0A375FKS9_9BURK|nr:protein of unknown function [Cupriavidus taiwanensis]SOZ72189.1 protein of unknown function [Cupriavidus taiwanensis]SOZ74488.1 protein of unknown function [Cupriavidus taiwanensis]SPA11352.1 protein of unknown function [Cupriavidus taiwanensis]SPA57161.1 protein of unknown function [Cupriavidus taiwanensis]